MTGRGTAKSGNQRRKSRRNRRGWGVGRAMGGQIGRERGGSGTVRKWAMSWEQWGKGVKLYGPHKVRGKWRMYVGTVEDMIVQKAPTGH